MNSRSSLLVCLAAGLNFAACVSSTGPVSAVPLLIPDPPAHSTIAPADDAQKTDPEPAPAPAVDNSGGHADQPVRASSPPPRPSAPAAQTPAPAPVAPSAPATPPPVAATELRPATAAGAQTLSAKQVREIMTRTQRKLNAVDRGKLNSGKRDDYDAARRFLSQADRAVNANDLLLAQSSAEKAEALANGLR